MTSCLPLFLFPKIGLLGNVTLSLAQALGDLPDFVDYYRRDLTSLHDLADCLIPNLHDVAIAELHPLLPACVRWKHGPVVADGFTSDSPVPSILDHLLSCIGSNSSSFLSIESDPWIREFPELSTVSTASLDPVCRSTRRMTCLYTLLSQSKVKGYKATAERLALAMVGMGIMSQDDLDDFPTGVALPLREALRACRVHPPQVRWVRWKRGRAI